MFGWDSCGGGSGYTAPCQGIWGTGTRHWGPQAAATARDAGSRVGAMLSSTAPLFHGEVWGQGLAHSQEALIHSLFLFH